MRLVGSFGPRWRGVVAVLLVAAVLAAVVGGRRSGSAEHEWSPTRLPFHGTYSITNGPNCSTHAGASAEAIDFPLARGTDVLAAQAGVVVSAGPDARYPGFGNVLTIRHDDQTVAWYAHLDTILKRPNDRVLNGEPIARSGNSGGVDAHLHFEVRDSGDQPVPIRTLPGITWYANDLCGTGRKPAGVAIGAPASTGNRTLLWFEILLPGVGRAGNAKVIAADQTKAATVKLRDASGTQVFPVTVSYQDGAGSFIGMADLGDQWPTGPYEIILRLPNTLGKQMPIFPTVRNGATTVLPKMYLKSGDTNDDNILNAFFDYQGLTRCFGVHRPPPDCGNETNLRGSDLNDDGRVDYEDDDLFITMVSVLEGD